LSEIGPTPRAKKAIKLAIDEACCLDHNSIGTEHLLLGLIREGEGIAAILLEILGVNLEKARTQTIQLKSEK
jgi:ATP-dependent Clp protease ATP-binding subunit ClpC